MPTTGAHFEWRIPPEKVFGRIPEALSLKQRQAAFLLFQHFAAIIENDMKASAPWTDQSGNLRQSLWAEARMLAESVVIAMDYGLSYGQFLEFSHAGHYAIIAPTVDKWFPIVWEAATKLLGLRTGGGVVRPTKE